MKPTVYFNWLLCLVFFIAGRQVHVGNSPAKQFHRAISAKTAFSFDSSVRAVFESSKPEQATTNLDSIIGIEDDDDEEEPISKLAPVIRHNTSILALCALPPPVSLSLKRISAATPSSLLRSCRYLAHQALLI